MRFQLTAYEDNVTKTVPTEETPKKLFTGKTYFRPNVGMLLDGRWLITAIERQTAEGDPNEAFAIWVTPVVFRAAVYEVESANV